MEDEKLRSLWLGELPLGEAFWTWAISVGLLVNVTSSALFLAMIMVDLPLAALLLGYGLSVPYNVLAAVGVWRSARRYEGPAGRAEVARAVALIVMLLLTVTRARPSLRGRPPPTDPSETTEIPRPADATALRTIMTFWNGG